MFTKGQQI